MAAPVLQFKRGLLADLPALRAGEPGFATDSSDFYIGLTSQSVNNKFFGSARYWTKETTTTGSAVRLVEGTDNGANYVALKSPDAVAANITYTLPGAHGANGTVLTQDGSGNLSWVAGSVNAVFSGISSFTDTTESDDTTTGAVIVSGGVGIAKNLNVGDDLTVSNNGTITGILTVASSDDIALQVTGGVDIDKNVNIAGSEYIGADLYVAGISTFVGTVTFEGGTINLGDSDADNINVAGEFVSDLTPNATDTYDIGINGKAWRNANFSGIGTFAAGAIADAIQIGVTAASEIDTSAGDLTLDSAGGQVIIDDNLSVAGVSTLTSGAVVNNIQVGISSAGEIDTTSGSLILDSAGGDIFAEDNLHVTGTLYAAGGITQASGEATFASATVSDLTAERVVLAGASGALVDDANLVYSGGGLRVGAGGINVTGVSTFSAAVVVGGDLRVNGNDIQASDGNTNITMTSNTLTTVAGDLKVTGNDIQDSGGVAITFDGSQNVTVAGDLQVSGNDIKDSGGSAALTFDGSTNVTTGNDLTVTGNLYVNGSTTQVNTTSLTVEDSLIEVGLVDGSAPGSDLNKDLGLLLNYFDGSAKKAAIYWDDSVSRMVVAAEVSESSSVLTASSYAAFEIGALYVNDCAGGTQVISCTGSERFLENITIDAGAF
jgi:hypothetical protein